LTTESLQLPKKLMENKNIDWISSYSKIIINYHQGSFIGLSCRMIWEYSWRIARWRKIETLV